MRVLLYIETNFLMGIAKGQDELAEDLLSNLPTNIDLLIPNICFVEALTTLEQENKFDDRFIHSLNIQVNEAERNKNSGNAKLVVSHLKQAKISFLKKQNDTRLRFHRTFNLLIERAEIIEFNTEILLECSKEGILENHILDKIILNCIIYHAKLHPHTPKVFLSSNSKEFGSSDVSAILRDVGILYFSKTQNFLGWLQSQNP